MTDQNNAKPLTGDEIRAAVKHAHIMSGPSDATQPGEYVLAGALALLSKLRAEGVQAGVPLLPSDALDALRDFKLTVIQDGFHKIGKPMIQQLAQAGALESLGFGKHRVTEYGEWLLSSARAALASTQVDPEAAEVDFLARVLESLDAWRAEDWSELLERRPAILALLRPMVLVSAPVAGEAVGHVSRDSAIAHMCKNLPEGAPLYAAPQASEAVRNQALAALESAQRFIRNGVEFGYIRMPDADTPDPAHRTPGLIDAAIRALSAQPGAQTPHPKQHNDGGTDAQD